MPRADQFSAFRTAPSIPRSKRAGRPRHETEYKNQKYSDEAIAAALRMSDGIIKDAAKKLNASYYTIYARVARTPMLRQLQESFRHMSFDFTETHLRKANKKGEQWAIKEMLKYRGHKYGYDEKTQTEVSGHVALTTESLNELSDEELDALLIRLDKRIAALAENTGEEEESADELS